MLTVPQVPKVIYGPALGNDDGDKCEHEKEVEYLSCPDEALHSLVLEDAQEKETNGGFYKAHFLVRAKGEFSVDFLLVLGALE